MTCTHRFEKYIDTKFSQIVFEVRGMKEGKIIMSKKKKIGMIVVQCVLLIGVVVCSNDAVVEYFQYNLAPYLCLCMLLVGLIGIVVNRR